MREPTCSEHTHVVEWGIETNDLGGGAHVCVCGDVLVDRSVSLDDYRIVSLRPAAPSQDSEQ